MQSVQQACIPRPEIMGSTFNPEIFVASLSEVVTDYANGRVKEGASSLYSDPVAFFREATHPTTGLCTLVDNALARLVNKDASRPAMQRLDTAFGGGKTHTLIALLHLVKQGKVLAPVTGKIVASERLGEPGSIQVASVIGDTVDVLRESESDVKAQPNTLWWLLAQQLLDSDAQKPISARLKGVSAPASSEFFDTLFGERPTLIIIDEIAQYLARMEAAFPGTGAEQTAAFLMALSTYARNRDTLSIALSLASDSNTFGGFNHLMRTLISTHELSEAQAQEIADRASKEVLDVVNRVAEPTTPVTEGDLSHIMAKRLFSSVDKAAAEATATAFVERYQQSGSELPSDATNEAVRDELVKHYPFHPTLIEFLSQKLSLVEDFQGTRGLLRTLARTVRSIWKNEHQISLIQTGHIDLSDSTIRAELLGRTKNNDFHAVLDSDISKVASAPATSRTVAGDLDAKNPHPDGYPVHEWAWRVVLLHSLIGRAGGLQDEHYGINLVDAVYEMASPAIPPATVRSALQQIEGEANFLRERNARLYADTVPTLNNILRRIQNSVKPDEAMERIEQVVQGLLSNSINFEVHSNITASDDIPDKAGKLQLGILAFSQRDLSASTIFEHCGNAVRVHQNQLLLLVPSITHLDGEAWGEQRTQHVKRTHEHIMTLAARAIAVEKLKASPDNWGIKPEQLRHSDFRDHAAKRPAELRTAVDENYRQLIYYSHRQRRVVNHDIGKRGQGPTGGGSGGLHLEDTILKQLADEGELITEQGAVTTEVIGLLSRLFFESRQQVDVSRLIDNFSQRRDWPQLQQPRLLGDILIQGVQRGGGWCLARFAERNAAKPDEFFHKEQPPPLNLDPVEGHGSGWVICTREHAKQLGWLENIVRDPNMVGRWAKEVIESREVADIGTLGKEIEKDHDRVDANVLRGQITHLISQGVLVAYPDSAFDSEGNADPDQAITAQSLPLEGVSTGKIVPRHIAQERGWLHAPKVQTRSFDLKQAEKIKQLLNLLSGAALKRSKSQVQALQIQAPMRDGGGFQLVVTNTTIGALVEANQLFATLTHQLDFKKPMSVRVTLGEPEPGCKFLPIIEKLEG